MENKLLLHIKIVDLTSTVATIRNAISCTRAITDIDSNGKASEVGGKNFG